ncbi:hypothetical protein AKJ16_DCAP02005 [Drosera capensis]
MGKLLCDSTTFPSPAPTPAPASINWPESPSLSGADLFESQDSVTSWSGVGGLEEQQRRVLEKLETKGVMWKHPHDKSMSSVFRLSHGGDVDSDGNCLFTASEKAMGGEGKGIGARELRRRTVRRFVEDLGEGNEEEKEGVEMVIRNMYSPDMRVGWGVHVVQEGKVLARKADREGLDREIEELVRLGMQREFAAESVYKERCIAVKDGQSWAKYMSISGSPDDEYDIVTLQYTEDGLLSVDENRQGHAAAFGDDIAIECLATEFKREIYVVQAHGSDAMVDEDNCVFFLPHRPRGPITEPPFFLFMKGTGWCGAGADHYEPLIAHPSIVTQEKAAFVL